MQQQRIWQVLDTLRIYLSRLLAWLVAISPTLLQYAIRITIILLYLIGSVILAFVGGMVFISILSVILIGMFFRGFYAAIQTYQNTVREVTKNVRDYAERNPRHLPRWLMRHQQPAHLAYYFDEAWRDVVQTFRQVWSPTQAYVQDWHARARQRQHAANNLPKEAQNVPKRFYHLTVGIGMFLGGFSYYASMLLIVAPASILHLVVNVIGMIVSAWLIVLFNIFSRLWRMMFRINYRCPHPNCHVQMTYPVFICPQCGTEHTRLRPNLYGVFYHTCTGPDDGTCGYRLPTFERLGRRSLVRQCPSCHRPLPNAIGEASDVHLPIMGGVAAGKSYFLTALTDVLQTKIGPNYGVGVRIPDPTQADQLTQNLKSLEQGNRLLKTSDADTTVGAVNLRLVGKRGRVPQLWYVYDAAGEHYGSEDRTKQQNYFKYVRGIFFLIDPFSLSKVQKQYAEQLKSNPTLSPSTESPENILNRVYDALRLFTPNQEKLSIAVILTKTDAFDLDARIGSSAAQRLIARVPTVRTEEDAIDFLVRQFLIDNGAANVVMQLLNQFSNVRFFSIAVVKNGRYAPQRIEHPLVWMLAQMGLVNAQQKRVNDVDTADRTFRRRISQHRLDQLRYYVWDSLQPPTVQPEDMSYENV